MDTILVTGGTGFIGKHLSLMLKGKGYNVLILSRSNSNNPDYYNWNVSKNYIDEEAIKKANYIIHLAGAGIADKRWTKKRRKEIFDSRIKSTKLLLKYVKESNHNLKGFISASGIGFYGAITSNKIFTELDESGKDFLSYTCKFWEKAALQYNSLNIRTVIFRTGVVFAKNGGALQKIIKPIKLGVGAVLGTGNQYMPWIHIDDLCSMYIKAIEDFQINGIYNAVSPEEVTNKQLTCAIADQLNKKIRLPKIPKFILYFMFGKMAVILLEGSRVSSEKIEKTNFIFTYKSIKKVLDDFY